MKTIKNALFTILTLITIQSYAQKTDLTGNWKLTDRTYLNGKQYVNALPAQLQITQTGNILSLVRTEVGPDENTPGTTSTIQINIKAGEKISGESGGQKFSSTASLLNGALKDERLIYPAGKDTPNLRLTYTYSVSADGGTLTVLKTFKNLENKDDQWSVKGTYQKQP